MDEQYTVRIDEDDTVIVSWPAPELHGARDVAILPRDTVAASTLTALLAVVRGGQR
jgi:hypothetical protein